MALSHACEIHLCLKLGGERLLFAEKQIESGDYITREDLEKVIENW